MTALSGQVDGLPRELAIRRAISALLSYWPILTIVAVGAACRLYRLRQPFDDFIAWRQSSDGMMAQNFLHENSNILYPAVNWTGPKPGYQGREFQTVSYLASLLYRLLGEHDWIGRGVAVAFGLLGIFALYQLVRLVWDERTALAAAAVLAVMPGAVFVDHSFIPDPAMVALVTTAAWMLVLYLRTDRTRYLLVAALIGMLGFLTKITGLIVGVALAYAVVVVLRRRQALTARRIGLVAAAAACVLAGVAAYYAWARHLAQEHPPHLFAGSGNWLWDSTLRSWLDQHYFLSEALGDARLWLWTAPLIGLALIGLVVRPPSPAAGEPGNGASSSAPWFFHLWLLGGVVFYAIGAKELVDNPWNFHVVSPAVAAVAGQGLVLVGSLGGTSLRRPSALARMGLALALVAVVGASGLRWNYKSYSKSSYLLGLSLHQVSRPGDLVVTMADTLGEPTAIYYSGRRGWIFPPASNDTDWTVLPADDQVSIRQFDRLRAGGADWFGVVEPHLQELRRYHPLLFAHIARATRLVERTPQYAIYRIQRAGQPGKEAA